MEEVSTESADAIAKKKASARRKTLSSAEVSSWLEKCVDGEHAVPSQPHKHALNENCENLEANCLALDSASSRGGSRGSTVMSQSAPSSSSRSSVSDQSAETEPSLEDQVRTFVSLARNPGSTFHEMCNIGRDLMQHTKYKILPTRSMYPELFPLPAASLEAKKAILMALSPMLSGAEEQRQTDVRACEEFTRCKVGKGRGRFSSYEYTDFDQQRVVSGGEYEKRYLEYIGQVRLKRLAGAAAAVASASVEVITATGTEVVPAEAKHAKNENENENENENASPDERSDEHCAKGLGSGQVEDGDRDGDGDEEEEEGLDLENQEQQQGGVSEKGRMIMTARRKTMSPRSVRAMLLAESEAEAEVEAGAEEGSASVELTVTVPAQVASINSVTETKAIYNAQLPSPIQTQLHYSPASAPDSGSGMVSPLLTFSPFPPQASNESSSHWQGQRQGQGQGQQAIEHWSFGDGLPLDCFSDGGGDENEKGSSRGPGAAAAAAAAASSWGGSSRGGRSSLRMSLDADFMGLVMSLPETAAADLESTGTQAGIEVEAECDKVDDGHDEFSNCAAVTEAGECVKVQGVEAGVGAERGMDWESALISEKPAGNPPACSNGEEAKTEGEGEVVVKIKTSAILRASLPLEVDLLARDKAMCRMSVRFDSLRWRFQWEVASAHAALVAAAAGADRLER